MSVQADGRNLEGHDPNELPELREGYINARRVEAALKAAIPQGTYQARAYQIITPFAADIRQTEAPWNELSETEKKAVESLRLAEPAKTVSEWAKQEIGRHQLVKAYADLVFPNRQTYETNAGWLSDNEPKFVIAGLTPEPTIPLEGPNGVQVDMALTSDLSFGQLHLTFGLDHYAIGDARIDGWRFPERWHLDDLNVNRDLWGHGISNTLNRSVMEMARRYGVPEMTSKPTNPRELVSLTDLGFRIIPSPADTEDINDKLHRKLAEARAKPADEKHRIYGQEMAEFLRPVAIRLR